MNVIIYIALFASILAIFISAIAIARVARWARSVHDLDWEAVAALIGDVGAVKKSITRLNGRLNGMDNANPIGVNANQKFDWEQQVAEHYAAQQNKPRSIGG
tara:strand:+ start:510 stop:815 length:306 start_codon:yes stop_codon:yes gene_type:complete